MGISEGRDITNDVIIVGERYGHHARSSGFEGFNRILKCRSLKMPVKDRYRSSLWGWRLDQAIAKWVDRRYYSAGILLNELTIAAHMLVRRGQVYHAIYGDTDIHLLGRIARATGNHLVVTFHEPPETLDWMQVDAKLLNTFSAVILVSESQRPYFEERMPRDRVHVVHHGMDLSFFTPADALSTEPALITVGSHLRDFVTLAKAMEQVWAVRPDVRLIAIGTRRENDKANLKLSIDDPRVTYLDGVDDARLLASYHTARIAVIPLVAATANNALLEAMACGLPVVSTDSGGISEYMGDAAGLLVPPKSPEAFAEAILQLLPATSAAQAMGRAGRAYVARWTYANVAERMRSTYATIAGRATHSISAAMEPQAAAG